MKLYEGLKVVEFTNNIAGPTIGQWMGEYGADVIHIEKPVFGDDTRGYPPMVNNQSISYYTLNHGKKSVILNLKDPEGVKIARDLLQDADILLESNRPGMMSRLGLGYETLHKELPKLIYVSVSAYGQKGPYAERGGYDLIAQSASGLMYYNGDDETGPVKVFTEVGDYCAAIAGFGGLNAALYYRERTGEGQQVDISLVRVLTYIAAKFDDHRIFHRKTKKSGTQGSRFCPYGVYKCPDGEFVSIACASDKMAQKFFRVIGRDDLADDPRFRTTPGRVEHQDYLYGELMKWIGEMKTAAKVQEYLTEKGIPATKIYDYEDVENDPHYNEAGWFVDIPMPDTITDIDSRRIVRGPFGFSEAEPEYPVHEGFGAGNHEVIGKLGYTDEQIDALEDKWEQEILKKLKKK